MPLVQRDAEVHVPRSDAEERARKIRPEYTRGALVRVAGAAHQAEAEWLQSMLLEEGIPSMVRRSAAFDVPDFLAAGPRDILVPESGAQAARELLVQADLGGSLARAPEPGAGRRAAIMAAALCGGAALASFVAWELVRALA